MEDLKKCPFCGGKSIIQQTGHGTTDNNSVSLSFTLRCKACGATAAPSCGSIFINLKGENGELNVWHDDRPKIINAWNRRVMLALPIKKKWFDMILSGEKKEEYREIKPYYTARFKKIWENSGYWNNYDLYTVLFRNGYSHNSPMFIAEVSLGLGTGKPEWGAEPGRKYYVLRIHNVYMEEDAECR